MGSASSIGGARPNKDYPESIQEQRQGISSGGQDAVFPEQLLGARHWARFKGTPFEDPLPLPFSTEETEAQRTAATSSGYLARNEVCPVSPASETQQGAQERNCTRS